MELNQMRKLSKYLIVILVVCKLDFKNGGCFVEGKSAK